MAGLAFGETGHVLPILSLEVSLRLELTVFFFKKLVFLAAVG